MTKVIQFSPGRSGSTLVWNILKLVLNDNNIRKSHSLSKINSSDRIVSTIRDPRDMLKSRLTIYDRDYKNIDDINTEIDAMIKYGMNDLFKYYSHKNVLVLRYELFWNNFDNVFDNLEIFLGIKIDSQKREQIVSQCNVHEMRKISLLHDTFNEFDKKTHIHGKHISNSLGRPDTWSQVIPAEFHDHVNRRLEKYLHKFGYA